MLSTMVCADECRTTHHESRGAGSWQHTVSVDGPTLPAKVPTHESTHASKLVYDGCSRFYSRR